MNYKKIISLFIIVFINSCTTYPIDKKEDKKKIIYKKNFTNKGFALVYDENLYKKKIITKELDNRSLIIFQKNLKKGTNVRVKNLVNEMYIIASVGADSEYPKFNNSILSQRVANEINFDPNNPYIEIYEILENSSFIIKKTKTFEEEKNVADKAPVDTISINDLNKKIKPNKKIKKIEFNYIIKIADFYYKDSAKSIIKRIKEKNSINNLKLQVLTNTKHRVYMGPFYKINSLQKAFNDISILNFENIEIIKNE
tara:strand:+ start:92 stop:856 length:765 start_codon:yes stop_codon:yes gene_type:complete